VLGRLSEKAGAPFETALGTRYSFPSAERVRSLPIRSIRSLGFSANKASAIQRLLELRGVERWTAEYVLLRGLGRIDLFPGDDIGARNSLRRWLNVNTPLDYAGVHRALMKWRRYAGLLYFHLLLHGLEKSGRAAA
jgi:DNA-3-methyladenine glycosylase II